MQLNAFYLTYGKIGNKDIEYWREPDAAL
jgi:hypothetical protein